MKKTKKIGWILIVVGALALIGVASNEVLEWLIIKKIEDNKELPYTIKFTDIDLNLLAMRVSVDSLSIHTDDTTGREIQIITDYALLAGWNWFTFLRNSKFKADNFEIVNPVFTLREGASSPSEDTATSASQNSLIRLESIHLRNINITNGSARIYRPGQDSAVITVDSLFVNVEKYSQYRQSGRDSFDVAQAKLRVKRFKYQTKNMRYDMLLEQIDAAIAEQQLTIGSFQLLPRYSKQQFSKVAGEQKGRLDLKVSGIEAHNFQFKKLLQKQILLDHFSVDDARLVVNKDKSVGRRDANKKKLPHVTLRDMEWPIRVDTTRVKSLDVRYEQFNPATNETGQVNFQRSYLSFYSITNIDSLIQKKPYAEADILSYFMGKGKLQAHFRFDLTSSAYSYSGSLGAMDLEEANAACIPLASIEIQSGQVHDLTFDIQANDNVANGTMNFAYENFKINLLKKQKDETKGILSFLANTLAIKNKNLERKDSFRTGTIYAERDKSRSIFDHIWDALRSGLQSTLLPDILLDDKLEKKK